MTIVKRLSNRLVSLKGSLILSVRNLTKFEWALAASIGTYPAIFSVYLIQKFEFFRTGYFDFGGLVQQAWLVSHGTLTTYVLGRPINLIVGGLYWLVPRPETLLVFQSFMMAIGALPLYALALKELERRWCAISFSTLYLTSAALWGVNQYEYHDMAIIIPLFLFAAYFYANGNLIRYLASFILALFSSELIVIIGLFLSGSFAIDYSRSRQRRTFFFFVSTAITASAWAIYLELSIFLPHYTFATLPPTGYTFTGSSQLLNPLVFLTNPAESIAYSWPAKYQYLIYLLAPLIFLPLLALRKLLPTIPWLAVVVGYSPLIAKGGVGPVYQLYSNWSSFLIPFVFVSGIYGLKRFTNGTKETGPDTRRLKQVVALMLIVSLSITATTGGFSPVATPVNFSGGDSSVPTYVDPSTPYHYVWPTPVPNYTILNSFVAMIPQNDSVLTQNVIGSKLAERLPPVYIFFQPGYKNVQADAILIDANVDGSCPVCMTTLLSTGNYTLYASYNEGGIYLYFKK